MLVEGGQWQRKPAVFAEKIEVGNVLRLLENGLIIEEGTAAILLQGGAFKDVLGPGRHNLFSLAHRINWWGDPPPRTVILVDSGDVLLPLRIESLRSAEEIPVTLYTEVIIRFREKGAADLVGNLLKERDRLSYVDLAEKLSGDIRYAAENLCNTSTIEDLVKDPERRLQLENALHTSLRQSLERYGLDLVRLAAVDFTGPQYEELRAKAGEIEILRRRLEFDQKLREMLASDQMQKFKSEQDVEEYVRQLAQEREVAAEHRDHELQRLKQVHRHELESDVARYQMAEEMEKVAHQIGVQLRWDDYTRDKLVKDARTQAEVKEISSKAEYEETLLWMKIRADKMRLEQQRLEQEVHTLAGQSLETLLAVLPPEKHGSLLQLKELALKEGRSAEELLALAAIHSPEAARVLAEIARAKAAGGHADEIKRMASENADRLERIFKTALDSLPKAHAPAPSNTQIIK